MSKFNKWLNGEENFFDVEVRVKPLKENKQSIEEIKGNSIKYGHIVDDGKVIGHHGNGDYYVSIYNEDEIDEMVVLIRDSFIQAFSVLTKTLENKINDIDAQWER